MTKRGMVAAHVKREKSQKVLSPILRVALLVGVAVHVAGFLLFKISSNRLPSYEETAPFVQFVSAGDAADGSEFIESAALLDSAPLFVPTKWNAARSDLRLPRLGEQVLFSEFEPNIDLVGELQPAFMEVAPNSAVERPADLLDFDVARVFEEYGRKSLEVVAFDDGGPFARFDLIEPAMRSGFEGTETLRVEADLALEAGLSVTAPAEFHLRLNGDGVLIGDPTLSDSSGNVAFDTAAKAWLRSPETLARLSPGYFHVRVYP